MKEWFADIKNILYRVPQCLFFKKRYWLAEVTSLLIRFNRFFSWNTKNTGRYGTNNQNTGYHPLYKRQDWRGLVRLKVSGRIPPFLKQSPYLTTPSLMGKIWNPPIQENFENWKVPLYKEGGRGGSNYVSWICNFCKQASCIESYKQLSRERCSSKKVVWKI